jgi:hypothetical protein
MRGALKPASSLAVITSANDSQRLLRSTPLPAIEMAGFESASSACFPVIEMAGFRSFSIRSLLRAGGRNGRFRQAQIPAHRLAIDP